MTEAVLLIISGILIGLFLGYLLIKKARLKRISGEEFSLTLPLIGERVTLPYISPKGVFTEEFLDLQRRLNRLKTLIDIEKVFQYADRFGVDYISTEGDMPDGSWSKGRYAFCNMSRSHKREFSIYLNPDIETEIASVNLTKELNTYISPKDVYPFVFLHEVGHTSRAGNKNFFAAVLNHTISGDRHSLSKRRDLFRLKGKIEEFADRFALKELKSWKQSC